MSVSMLRVVVLGASFGRTVHVPALRRHGGYEVVGIAGSTPERSREVAAELGIADGDSDWRALLARTRPELVIVATPVDLHHPMTMAALDQGAHVLCEKPTALHRFQAAEMRDRARALQRVLAIHHEFRMFPARRHALERVARGDIGTPRRGEILGRYALWTRPETRAMSWLADRARGGGILGALGSHHTDCLRTFLGEPETALATVRVQQPHRGPTPTSGATGIATADDACTVQYTFANGGTGVIDLDATAPYRWERFEIHGTDATLRWDETGYRLWRVAAGAPPEELEIPEPLRLAPREGEPALLAPCVELLDRLRAAIRDGVRMEPDFDDAVAVQAALDAARESSDAETRVAVRIPPAA